VTFSGSSTNKTDRHDISEKLLKSNKQKQTNKKLTNQKQELPVAAMFANGSGRNEQSL
jgi:hypothetical protein